MNLGGLDPAIRYGAAFLVPLVAALVLTPLAGKLARRLGVMDDPGGHKTHGESTPYLGGVAVAIGMLAVAAVAGGASGQLLTILIAATVLGFLGLIDDVQNVPPILRLAYEATAGVALWLVGVRAGIFHVAAFDLPLTVLWVVVVTNAFNFIDNTDGVAAGVTAASTLGIGAIAASNGDYLVASLALAVAGASLGFLRYNFPPAKIFLGDAGSMFLGFLVAALILQIDLPVGPGLSRALDSVLLAGVPLFDLTLVVTARIREGRPIWQGGADHSAHRLSRQGRSKRAVVYLTGLVQLGLSAAAFVVFRLPLPAVVGLTAAVMAAWITLLVWFLGHPSALLEG